MKIVYYSFIDINNRKNVVQHKYIYYRQQICLFNCDFNNFDIIYTLKEHRMNFPFRGWEKRVWVEVVDLTPIISSTMLIDII